MSNSPENKTDKKAKYPFWFYLILTIIPIIFFVLLEICLRIFNYGRNDEQWIKISETKQMLNPDISGRYFFNTKDLPQSNNDVFDIEKRSNAFRIFIMGESSAQGFPFSPNGTFSRYIRDRLELLYPELHIEVINIAITATNSYTIRDLVLGVLEQKPDLVLIYAGHNEYYGAFGVGSIENVSNSRSTVNFIIWLNKFKVFELVQKGISFITGLFSKDNDDGGTLMSRIVKEKLIPIDSELFNSGLTQFEENLNDILKILGKSGVPVIIGTQVSNLKDQKPFISIGDNVNSNADLNYVDAQLQLKLRNVTTADSLFRNAKDLDALRFRAPEKINNIIKQLVEKYSCGYVDIDSIFNKISPDGIVGKNLIVDHLHPSLRGYQLMGKFYFDVMELKSYLPGIEQLQISEFVQDSIVIANFAFSHLDSVIANIRLTGLLNDWPFVEKRDFSFIKKIKLDDRIDSIAFRIAIENMNWEKGHKEAADWYLKKKDYKNFAKEYQVLISQYPFRLDDYDYAASELINVKEYDLAYNFLLKRYKETPDVFSAKWLGNIILNKGKTEEAIKYLTESLSLGNSDAQVYYNLAGAYFQTKKYDKALESIDKCLVINPDFPKARMIRDQLILILSSQ